MREPLRPSTLASALTRGSSKLLRTIPRSSSTDISAGAEEKGDQGPITLARPRNGK